MKQSNDETWSYEEYRELLDAWLRKNAQKKAAKARRTERDGVRQLGRGKAVAFLLLKPITRKRA